MKKLAVITSLAAVPSVCCKACGCRKAQVGRDDCAQCEHERNVKANIEAIENGQGSEKET